jgi:hypothetical protein
MGGHIRKELFSSEGNAITDLNGSVIAQYTSDYRELTFNTIHKESSILMREKY